MAFPLFGSISIGWRDILDIALITLLFYNIIIMVRQTRAVTAIYGLLTILAVYILSRALGLNTLNWLLEYLLGSLFLLVVIVFQRDIRQALTTIGARRFWFTSFFRKKGEYPTVPLICAAAEYMAQRRIGALIVIERNVPLGDTTDRGVMLDALVSTELLINLFWPNSPLHDGAAIIRDSRIVAAGCILPLSPAVAKRDYGTRHRAALGITEETDAVVVVVSEERGAIALAVDGKLTAALDAAKLPRVLHSALEKKL
ncbi:MAG: diadenylate cyclase CdaA [Desulfovibrionaceae bacterium]|nr:diadenylate cyclase CdaA [Desulfovibrionaceae bacterium]